MDAGASFGIVDGLQFAIEGNKTLRVMIIGIQVKYTVFDFFLNSSFEKLSYTLSISIH